MDVAAMILIKALMMAVLQICQIKILRCEINLALIRLQNRIRTRQAHPNSRGTWKTGRVNRQVTIVITVHSHDTDQIHSVISKIGTSVMDRLNCSKRGVYRPISRIIISMIGVYKYPLIGSYSQGYRDI